MKKRNEKELAWKNVAEAVNTPDYTFSEFPKERLLSRARLSHETRGTHTHTDILFGVYCIRPLPPTRIDFYTHTHTHTRAHSCIFDATIVKPCMYRRAIARACKSRNYNASRGENARVIRLILRFFSLPSLFAFARARARSSKWKCKRKINKHINLTAIRMELDLAMRQKFSLRDENCSLTKFHSIFN